MPEGERISQVLWHFYFKHMTLDFLVINTFDVNTLGVTDTSIYDTDPPNVVSPTMSITVPGYTSPVAIPFVPGDFNIFNSIILGLSTYPSVTPLPDGVYYLKYTVDPALTYHVEKNIMRTNKIQEKFDSAFMKLDMMECDSAIRTQAKVVLSSIGFMIQGSIAAANNCAIDTANKLYVEADRQLNNFIKTNCGCTGNNYVNNFH